MPRDLFGDVTRPSISIGDRKWYTVPVSLLSHSVIIAMFVALPILAAPYLPAVLDNETAYYVTTKLPTPPPEPVKQHADLKPIENPGPPIEAPTGFAKEPEVIRDPPATGEPGGWIGGGDIDHVLAPPPETPKKAAPPETVRVGGTIRQPLKVRNVDPVYPAIAQAAHVQGTVIIEATLSPDGRMMNARILRSVPLLDQAALEAVRQWEYRPTMLNGVPVPVIMTITVTFTLSK